MLNGKAVDERFVFKQICRQATRIATQRDGTRPHGRGRAQLTFRIRKQCVPLVQRRLMGRPAFIGDGGRSILIAFADLFPEKIESAVYSACADKFCITVPFDAASVINFYAKKHKISPSRAVGNLVYAPDCLEGNGIIIASARVVKLMAEHAVIKRAKRKLFESLRR